MISWALSISLILTPLGSLFEPIQVHGALVLQAEYLQVGHKLKREMMALSIEDFALLQSELEVANEAWELRLQGLVNEHERSYSDLQSQFSTFKTESALELSKRDILIQSANTRAASAETVLRDYKIALILTTVVASGAIVFLAAGD
jgi:hypothetical protein